MRRARKMLRTNAEILDLFSDGDLAGSIRFGVPDDYAVRLLPVILSSFQRTHPKIVGRCACQPSEELLEGMRTRQVRPDRLHPGHRTRNTASCSAPNGCSGSPRMAVRRCSRIRCRSPAGQHCCWKDNAIEVLNRIGRDYRIAYTSSNAIAISSAVLTDLAVGFLPESALQPGMRVIAEDKDLPRLRDAQIALMRAAMPMAASTMPWRATSSPSMGNLDGSDPLPMAAE